MFLTKEHRKDTGTKVQLSSLFSYLFSHQL